MMTPMAISNYLGLFLLLVLVYPFAMIAINFVIYEQARRNRIVIWFSIICVLIAMLLLVLHMKIEIIYGKELLDAWRLHNPQ